MTPDTLQTAALASILLLLYAAKRLPRRFLKIGQRVPAPGRPADDAE